MKTCRVLIASVVCLMLFLAGFNYGGNIQNRVMASSVQPDYSGNDTWELTFEDEFNGSEVDETKWTIRDLDQYSYHKKDYVSVSDGKLKLKIDRENNKTYLGRIDTHKYDTAINDAFWDQKYGYFECSMDVPPTNGTYGAFWLQNYPGVNNVDGTGHDGAEIDIVETYKQSDYYQPVIHYDGYGSSHKKVTTQPFSAPNLHDGFHTYGMEWAPNYLKFYYDGELKWTYTGVAVPRVKEIIILSSGHGTWVEGNISNADLPYFVEVDYVRAWTKVETGEPTNYAQNGDFESGNKSPWTNWKVAGVTAEDQYEGDYCGYTTKSSSLEQVITGLSPNTTYTYTAYCKLENENDTASLGVKNYGGVEKNVAVTGTDYAEYSVTFTTGSSSTTAKIYFYKAGGTNVGKGFIDQAVVNEVE